MVFCGSGGFEFIGVDSVDVKGDPVFLILLVEVSVEIILDLVNILFCALGGFEDQDVLFLDEGFLFFLVGPDTEVTDVLGHVKALPL